VPVFSAAAFRCAILPEDKIEAFLQRQASLKAEVKGKARKSATVKRELEVQQTELAKLKDAFPDTFAAAKHAVVLKSKAASECSHHCKCDSIVARVDDVSSG